LHAQMGNEEKFVTPARTGLADRQPWVGVRVASGTPDKKNKQI
jgi:hypothetical protein